MQEHKLEAIPVPVFSLLNLRTLDISSNKLEELPSLLANNLENLKVLKCDNNKIVSLGPIENLKKLQNLSACNNRLQSDLSLPISLKELNLKGNNFENVPRNIISLTKLQVLNLSQNNLASFPADICSILASVVELNLDDNQITSLPEEIGKMKKLKLLSLKNNAICGNLSHQALPSSLFVNTPVIDISLHGNTEITATQLNNFDGFDKFLERRTKVKNKDLAGFDQLTGKYTCGLT